MQNTKITDTIQYVGTDDKNIDLFESQYIVPNGVSYNSYVILDEKTAVMDGVDERAEKEWFENLEHTLNGKQPASTGEIPQNTYYAARKFARYFVVIEGAYWLMSQNKFKSFSKEDVLSGLKENCKQFEDIFELTDSILRDPVDAGIGHVTYLKRIEPFVEWIFESISTGDAIA